MKALARISRLALLSVLLFISRTSEWSHAESTVHSTDRYSWAPNIGWIDWRGDGTNGAIFTNTIVSGHIYGANVGWVSLGDGSPADGSLYGNDSA